MERSDGDSGAAVGTIKQQLQPKCPACTTGLYPSTTFNTLSFPSGLSLSCLPWGSLRDPYIVLEKKEHGVLKSSSMTGEQADGWELPQ